MKRPVRSEHAPAPRAGAPYSQGIAFGQLVFVSGQLPIDVRTGQVVEGGVAAQTAQCLRNVEAVLVAAGSDLSGLLKTTVFLADRDDWPAMNAAYGELIPAPAPSRSVVQVGGLPGAARVSIEAVAALPERSSEDR